MENFLETQLYDYIDANVWNHPGIRVDLNRNLITTTFYNRKKTSFGQAKVFDFTKELMDRWLNTAQKVEFSVNYK